MKIDFHTHTIASDGQLTPTQLVNQAKKIGLTYIVKTDHDTVGLMNDFLDAGKKYNIHTIPGIEISARFKNKAVHILGLNIDYHNKELINYCKTYTRVRRIRSNKIIAKLKKLEWYIDNKQLKNELITRPHLALAVIKHSQNKNRLIKEFGQIPTFGTFINAYIIPGKSAYVPKSKYFTAKATIELIHQARGLAIVAHPLTKSNEFNYSASHLKSLLKLNFDGLEVYHPDHSANEIKTLLTLATKYNLLVSGGSDYHNSDNHLGHYNRHCLTVKLCPKLFNKLTKQSSINSPPPHS